MRILNTCGKLQRLFSGGKFNLETWRIYAAQISPELPALCETDLEKYDFEQDVLPVITACLQRGDKLEQVSLAFDAVTKQLTKNLTSLFAEEPDIQIILYLGLCNGAGWATTLDGKPAVLLGIEKIMELDWGGEAELQNLIYHEIGHIWHFQTRTVPMPPPEPETRALMQLYTEGMAMVCEQILCQDPDYFHQDTDGWLDWCLQNEAALKTEYLRRVQAGESIQDFFGDWCSYDGHSDVGYFLGCRFIRFLLRDHALPELADLPYEALLPKLEDYVSS